MEIGGVVELPAAIVVQEALGLGTVGYQYLVAIQFDMDVGDLVDCLRLPD